uniref:VASt domain-containing protein n=1 Tax=Clastoptera arizonana TaxID=38151 RepID=A0A1B6EAL1_9HEMI
MFLDLCRMCFGFCFRPLIGDKKDSASINKETKITEDTVRKCDIELSTTNMSDNAKTEVDSGPAASCPIIHEGRMLVDEVYPINVDELFKLLFTDSKFAAELHETRKNSDIKQGSWEMNPDSQQKMRRVSLTVPVAVPSVGLGIPKHSHISETQVMLSCSKPGDMYAIEIESYNSGIPYADSFFIATHFCLTRGSHSLESTINVYCQIKYRKSVWGLVKSFIEKNCWTGLEEYYTALINALKTECENHKSLETNVIVSESEEIKTATSKPVVKTKTSQLRLAEPIENKSFVQSILSISLPDWLLRVDISWLILSVLLVLLVLNVILYHKLWDLEDSDKRYNSMPFTDMQFSKEMPQSQDEWIALLRKQERIHDSEIQHWQTVLKRVISHLRQSEEALSELQGSLYSIVSHRVLSALKEAYSESPDVSASASKQEL